MDDSKSSFADDEGVIELYRI